MCKLIWLEREEERLEAEHDVIFRFSGNRLYFPSVEDPEKILDCGYGRGDWAVAVAEEYEDCEVCSHVQAAPSLDKGPVPPCTRLK
jgi:cyclopropane fatty-acyl-phospholipid synthase-like methyltransferase